MREKKTWRAKLADAKGFPRLEAITGAMLAKWGPGTLLLPAPHEILALMRSVPNGKVITIDGMRATLARRHRATVTCPILTGIFARIAAGAAGEDEADGKRRVTPYWRTLKAGGEINAKYPGGGAGQRARLEAEGHTVIAKGKRFVVRDFARSLAREVAGDARPRRPLSSRRTATTKADAQPAPAPRRDRRRGVRAAAAPTAHGARGNAGERPTARRRSTGGAARRRRRIRARG